MPLTVTAADIRDLYASHAEDPVLYVATDRDAPYIDVWAAAYVPSGRVIAHRHELIDLIGDDAAAADDALPELQATADEIVAAQRA